MEVRSSLPVEVGVLVLVTAKSEYLAGEIAKLINPFLLHYPLTDNEEILSALSIDSVATIYHVPVETLMRFDLPDPKCYQV